MLIKTIESIPSSNQARSKQHRIAVNVLTMIAVAQIVFSLYKFLSNYVHFSMKRSLEGKNNNLLVFKTPGGFRNISCMNVLSYTKQWLKQQLIY